MPRLPQAPLTLPGLRPAHHLSIELFQNPINIAIMLIRQKPFAMVVVSKQPFLNLNHGSIPSIWAAIKFPAQAGSGHPQARPILATTTAFALAAAKPSR